MRASAGVWHVKELHSTRGGEGSGVGSRQGHILGLHSSLPAQLVPKVEVDPFVQLGRCSVTLQSHPVAHANEGCLHNAFCAALCCAVLCCAVLCCAVLCCAVLCCAVLCCAVLCCIEGAI